MHPKLLGFAAALSLTTLPVAFATLSGQPARTPYTTWSDYAARYTGPLGRAFRTGNGLTAIAPPWSEIVAYDLNEGTIKWRRPVGTSPALAARGIKDTGNGRRFWRNGPVVTAGGLLFIGTWADRTVRALETATGAVLWERALEANPEGVAAVFEANGRQYVAFCASGTDKQDTPLEKAFEARPGLASAQGYYVFALPQTPSSGR